MKWLLLLIALLVPSYARAQALPTPNERLSADIASYVVLGANVALDTRESWQSTNRTRAFALQGTRLGVTYGSVALLKHFFPRARPCAPVCGIDDPNADFPSGHTAFAFAAAGSSPRRYVLATSVGELRMLANKHDLLGVLSGAGIGLLTSRIR